MLLVSYLLLLRTTRSSLTHSLHMNPAVGPVVAGIVIDYLHSQYLDRYRETCVATIATYNSDETAG